MQFDRYAIALLIRHPERPELDADETAAVQGAHSDAP